MIEKYKTTTLFVYIQKTQLLLISSKPKHCHYANAETHIVHELVQSLKKLNRVESEGIVIVLSEEESIQKPSKKFTNSSKMESSKFAYNRWYNNRKNYSLLTAVRCGVGSCILNVVGQAFYSKRIKK